MPPTDRAPGRRGAAVVSASPCSTSSPDWGSASTLSGIIIAHMIVTGPHVVRRVSASLARFDRSLELAAATLGVLRLQTFWRVTLPLILPGVTAGAVFAFIVSFDELTVTSPIRWSRPSRPPWSS